MTKKVVEYAHAQDPYVTVEGELGVLAGVEDEVSHEGGSKRYNQSFKLFIGSLLQNSFLFIQLLTTPSPRKSPISFRRLVLTALPFPLERLTVPTNSSLAKWCVIYLLLAEAIFILL